MKALIAITIFGLCIVQTSLAQTASQEKRDSYRAWITTYEALRSRVGVLYEIQDSSLIMSNLTDNQKKSPVKLDMSKIDVRSIDVVKVRKNGTVGRGILYGALAGLAVGVGLDLIFASTWKTPEESNDLVVKLINTTTTPARVIGNSILVGIGCVGVGIGVGAVIGSAKIAIPIHGSQEQFDRNRSLLRNYSVKQTSDISNKTFSKLRDSVGDIDGNVYSTLALGGQVWMGENLKVLHHRDGTEIDGATSLAPGDEHRYSWRSVSGKQKICPFGWHIPELFEWTSMIRSLGGEDVAGYKMEITFSALGKPDQWWSSSELDADRAYYIYLSNKTTGAMFTGKDNASGLSVRCIRD